MNVFVIGATMDLTLALVDRPEPLWARILYLAFGVWLWGPGSGLYLGVGPNVAWWLPRLGMGDGAPPRRRLRPART